MGVIILGFATLSTVLQIVALAFLILAIISTPISPSLKLAKAGSYTYGIFGYCNGSACSGTQVPYSPSSVNDKITDWLMSDSARDTLAKILIVAPIAGGFTLLSLLTGLVSHFRFLANSSGIFIVGIVFSTIAFLVSTLICIVVILLFYPYLVWTGWILIGAAAANLLAIIAFVLGMIFTPKSLQSDYDEDYEEESNLMGLKLNDDYKTNNIVNIYDPPLTDSGLNNNVPTYNNYKNDSFTTKTETRSNLTSTSNSIKPQIQDFTKHDGYSSNMLNQGPNTNSNSGINLVQGPGSAIQRSIAPSIIARTATREDSNEGLEQPHSAQMYGNTPYPLDEEESNISRPSGNISQRPKVPYPDASQNAYHSSTSVYDERSQGKSLQRSNEYVDEGVHQNTDNQSDTGSDFTSVSQRGINPNYQAQAFNHGVNPASQGPPPTQYQNHQNYQAQQIPTQQYQNYQPQQMPPQQYHNYQPNSQGSFNSQGTQHSYRPQNPQQAYNPQASQQSYQQSYQPSSQQSYPQSQPRQVHPNFVPPSQRAPPRQKPNVSDTLLANNPDFMIGRKPGAGAAGGLPAFNKRKPGIGGTPLPSASMSQDSPYGNLR